MNRQKKDLKRLHCLRLVAILCGALSVITILSVIISIYISKVKSPEKHIHHERKYDFGTIYDDKSVKHTYNIKNSSLKTLKFEGAKSQCSNCTKIEVVTPSIEPGETGSFVVEFIPNGYWGPVQQEGYLKTNIPNFIMYFEYSAFVHGATASKVIDFGVFDDSDQLVQKAEISIYGPGKYSITEEAVADIFEISLGYPEFQDRGTNKEIWRYRPEIRVDKTRLPVGPFRSTITLRVRGSDAKHDKLVSIKALGYNKGVAKVEPQNIFYGNIDLNDEITKNCTFTINPSVFNKIKELQVRSINEAVTGVVRKQKNNTLLVELTYKNTGLKNNKIDQGYVEIINSSSRDVITIIRWMAILKIQ